MSLFPLQSKQSRQSWQSAEVPCCGRVDRLRSRWTEQWVALTLSRRLSLSAITKSYYYGHDLCLWFIIWLWWLLYCNHYIYIYIYVYTMSLYVLHSHPLYRTFINSACWKKETSRVYNMYIYIIIIYNIGLPSTHQRQSKQEQSNAMSLPGWFLDNMIFGWEPL